ncbi:aminotransferase A [Gracilibacillus sp. YIM 98692]|uniref:aminotransferase A n=1 Tax=Gracilibacillus sp. YIM 98692 TaxID=2663532 RepID=UPI0013D6DA85|nr:aminotransferase A [Gracilibacillus sp. YIM 98692]
MEHLINQQVKQIEISGIRKFFNLVSGESDVLSLTIGQPDFPTPDHIKDCAAKALHENKTAYTHNAGIIELRRAISDFMYKKYHVHYNPENEILVTVGASQAIDVALRTIINEGDEVILPGPVYPGYEPLIKLAGGKPVFIDTRDNHFKLTKELIKSAITDRTKCILMPYPSNPTGVSLTESELHEITNLVKDKNIFLIADEIYSELVYKEKHISAGQFEQVKDHIIIINGVSKSHSMTGFRIGFLMAPKWLTRHMIKVHQYNVSCASSISQYAALEAIKNGENDSIVMKEAYRERRDFVYRRLSEMNLNPYLPDGGFYFFINISHLQKDSFDIALDLVKEAKVALVPGSAFSKYGEGFLRLSYAYDIDTLAKGLDRIEKYLNK